MFVLRKLSVSLVIYAAVCGSLNQFTLLAACPLCFLAVFFLSIDQLLCMGVGLCFTVGLFPLVVGVD